MASSLPSAQTQQTVTTVVIEPQSTTPVLKLRKPKTDKKLKWSEETVDNENMGKKKSKCCCIYKKQRFFGESSSDESDPDETDHCRGHKGKCYHSSGGPPNSGPNDNNCTSSP